MKSYAKKLVTVWLGGVLKLLDPVRELNPLNDFRQSVFAAKFCYFFLIDIISLKFIDSAVFLLKQPLAFRVRLRTVVKMLSIGFYNSERPHTVLDKRTLNISYFAQAEIWKAAWTEPDAS